MLITEEGRGKLPLIKIKSRERIPLEEGPHTAALPFLPPPLKPWFYTFKTTLTKVFEDRIKPKLCSDIPKLNTSFHRVYAAVASWQLGHLHRKPGLLPHGGRDLRDHDAHSP